MDSPHGELNLIGSGFRLAHGGGSIETAPVPPGAHADEVLAEAGYDDDQIQKFRDTGVI